MALDKDNLAIYQLPKNNPDTISKTLLNGEPKIIQFKNGVSLLYDGKKVSLDDEMDLELLKKNNGAEIYIEHDNSNVLIYDYIKINEQAEIEYVGLARQKDDDKIVINYQKLPEGAIDKVKKFAENSNLQGNLLSKLKRGLEVTENTPRNQQKLDQEIITNKPVKQLIETDKADIILDNNKLTEVKFHGALEKNTYLLFERLDDAGNKTNIIDELIFEKGSNKLIGFNSYEMTNDQKELKPLTDKNVHNSVVKDYIYTNSENLETYSSLLTNQVENLEVSIKNGDLLIKTSEETRYQDNEKYFIQSYQSKNKEIKVIAQEDEGNPIKQVLSLSLDKGQFPKGITGHYCRRDENGNILKDTEGKIIYDHAIFDSEGNVVKILRNSHIGGYSAIDRLTRENSHLVQVINYNKQEADLVRIDMKNNKSDEVFKETTKDINIKDINIKDTKFNEEPKEEVDFSKVREGLNKTGLIKDGEFVKNEGPKEEMDFRKNLSKPIKFEENIKTEEVDFSKVREGLNKTGLIKDGEFVKDEVPKGEIDFNKGLNKTIKFEENTKAEEVDFSKVREGLNKTGLIKDGEFAKDDVPKKEAEVIGFGESLNEGQKEKANNYEEPEIKEPDLKSGLEPGLKPELEETKEQKDANLVHGMKSGNNGLEDKISSKIQKIKQDLLKENISVKDKIELFDDMGRPDRLKNESSQGKER